MCSAARDYDYSLVQHLKASYTTDLDCNDMSHIGVTFILGLLFQYFFRSLDKQTQAMA